MLDIIINTSKNQEIQISNKLTYNSDNRLMVPRTHCMRNKRMADGICMVNHEKKNEMKLKPDSLQN